MNAVGLRRAVAGALCPATRMTVETSWGILKSVSVGLEVQGYSEPRMLDGANRVPTLLGAHHAERLEVANALLVVRGTIVRPHHRQVAVYDSHKVPGGPQLAGMKSEMEVGWMAR